MKNIIMRIGNFVNYHQRSVFYIAGFGDALIIGFLVYWFLLK